MYLDKFRLCLWLVSKFVSSYFSYFVNKMVYISNTEHWKHSSSPPAVWLDPFCSSKSIFIHYRHTWKEMLLHPYKLQHKPSILMVVKYISAFLHRNRLMEDPSRHSNMDQNEVSRVFFHIHERLAVYEAKDRVSATSLFANFNKLMGDFIQLWGDNSILTKVVPGFEKQWFSVLMCFRWRCTRLLSFSSFFSF